jgi:hypothetical protein
MSEQFIELLGEPLPVYVTAACLMACLTAQQAAGHQADRLGSSSRRKSELIP